MTKYIEVYGTLPEAREYIAEEFDLPVLPPPISVIPPQDIRSGPRRVITYYPEESMGSDSSAPVGILSGLLAFVVTSFLLR